MGKRRKEVLGTATTLDLSLVRMGQVGKPSKRGVASRSEDGPRDRPSFREVGKKKESETILRVAYKGTGRLTVEQIRRAHQTNPGSQKEGAVLGSGRKKKDFEEELEGA